MPSNVVQLIRSDVVLGRDEELAAIIREHDESQRLSRAGFVFLRGAAGIGKSQLTRLAAQTLRQHGATVFESASPRHGRRTWGLVRALTDELTTFASRAGVPDSQLASLTEKVALLRDAAEHSPSKRRLEAFDAFAQLCAIASRQDAAFIFHDLDVADAASLELLHYVAALATTPSSPVRGLFVLSFRDGAALPERLTEILHRVSGRTIALSGLSLEGIRSFLSQPEVAQQILEVTSGHPETLRAFVAQGAPIDLPSKRLELVAEESKRVLRMLALSPEPLTAAVIAELVSEPLERVASTLDAVTVERFATAVVHDGHAVWKLTREGDRAVLLGGMTTTERARLERALGLVFLRMNAFAAARTLLSAVNDPHVAQATIEAARQVAARGAFEDAAALLAGVYAKATAVERATIARLLTSTSVSAGRLKSAARYALAAARLSTETNTYLAEAAQLLIKSSKPRRAKAVVEALKAKHHDSRDALALDAELELLVGRAAEAAALCRGALSSEPQNPQQADVSLGNTLGKALMALGQVADAREAFARTAQTAARLGLQLQHDTARINEAGAKLRLGDRDAALSDLSSLTSDDSPARALALSTLGSTYAEMGASTDAIAHLSRALQAFSRMAAEKEAAHVALNLARVHHFLGDLERATELSAYVLDGATRRNEQYLIANALLNRGALTLDSGKPAASLASFDDARVRFERIGHLGYQALSAALKARAHLELGERAQAELELARHCIEPGCARLPDAHIETELVRADLALMLGDSLAATRALGRLKDAILSHAEVEAPIRVYDLSGRIRMAANDEVGAQLEFQRAGRLLDALIERIPAPSRQAFLAVPRRADIVTRVEPESRLPRAIAVTANSAKAKAALGLIGSSASLEKITRQVEPIGRANTTVLIRGESGTGKELLADALHAFSTRRSMPLIKVNCAAMVEELLLSELFGHEKGAFTGAIRDRKGRFELADGGTIFLDEIGDISPKAQVALLRVLQEREFERVGGTKTIKVDVRVICATNRDLESLIAQGKFRADLYYRLKGVMLSLPPLRERLEDIPSLAQHFLEKATKEKSNAPRRLSPDALSLLSRHSWPGNVRELENVVSSSVIFAEGAVVTPEAFAHVDELHALWTGIAPKQVAPLAPTPLAVAPAPVTRAPVQTPEADDDGDELDDESLPSVGSLASPSGGKIGGKIDFYELARAQGISLKALRHQVEMSCIKSALIEAKGNISEAARLLRMKRSRLSQIVNAEAELKEVAHGDE